MDKKLLNESFQKFLKGFQEVSQRKLLEKFYMKFMEEIPEHSMQIFCKGFYDKFLEESGRSKEDILEDFLKIFG